MTVSWTEPAEVRLKEIFDYHLEVANRRTARKITNEITERTRILAQNPQAGPVEELLKERRKEHRYLIEGNYKIIYRIDPEVIWVVAVFDCRQNPEKILEEVG